MELFRNFLSAIGITSRGNKKIDFISELPVEISQHLLRMLDAPSLLNVARVSRKWLSVCKGDFRLRQSTRRHLRKQKLQLVQNPHISRKSKKTRQTHDINSIQTNTTTRRTYITQAPRRGAPLASSTRSILRITDSTKKPSINTRSVSTTRSSIRLR